MDEKRQKKSKSQIIISTLIFAIAFFMEIYVVSNNKDSYIFIGGCAIAALLSLAFLINAMIDFTTNNNKQRAEQYENLYRSEKASYLMTKKNQEQLLQRIERVERVAIVPTEEIVSAQKGIAKVIINRNRENAEAIMNSNDLLNERFDDFEKRLKTNNREHIDETKAVNNENLQQFLEKQQEIIINLKDMELRLNTSIMQAQKMLAEQKAIIEHSKMVPQSYIQEPIVKMPDVQVKETLAEKEDTSNISIAEEASQKINVEEVIPEAIREPSLDELVVNEESMSEPEIETMIPEEEITGTEAEIAIPELEPEAAVSEPEIFETEPEIAIPETEPEAAVSEPEISETEPEIAIPETEPEAAVSEPEISETEPEKAEIKEDIPPMPDLSDPNKTMGPDEIAALLANMTQDESDTGTSENTDQVEEEGKKEEDSLIEVLDVNDQGDGPILPMSDDPNKMMTPDEIAALVSAGAEESKEEEKTPEPPQPSDPNKMMSPDEIAALIANTAEEEVNASIAETEKNQEISEDIVPDDIINEVSTEVEEAPSVEEEKPPMPDLSDPNKKLSPDEIAALFANM